MTITISNLTVANNAPPGTGIGVLTTYDASDNVISCTYTLSKDSAGYFIISGTQLVTAWSVPIPPGHYSVRVHAMGNNTPFSASANFAVKVVMAALPPPPPPPPRPLPPPPPPTPLPPPTPPPPPPVITVTPSNPTIPDTTPVGVVVASFAVTMSDGSPFTGTVGFGAPNFDAGGIFAISGNNIIVNPSGPGVGPNTTTLTDLITLEAIQ